MLAILFDNFYTALAAWKDSVEVDPIQTVNFYRDNVQVAAQEFVAACQSVSTNSREFEMLFEHGATNAEIQTIFDSANLATLR